MTDPLNMSEAERHAAIDRALRFDGRALSRVGVQVSRFDRWRVRWWLRLGRTRRAQRILLGKIS